MFKPKFTYHPGKYINDELKTRNWDQKQFAENIGIPVDELNKIIKGKKNLNPVLCERIGEAFGTSADLWKNMQTGYSLNTAMKK